MLGRSDQDFFPREQADVFVAKDEQVFTRRVTNLNEETITDASGAEHVILTRKAVFEDDFGEDVLVGVITDITERKRTEEVLRLGAEVFEHSAEGIMVTGHEGAIVAVNRAFVEITGYSVEEAIGRNAYTLGSGRHDQRFFDAIFAAADRDGWWKGEIINRRKGGEIYVVEQTICAVRDDTGRVRRYIAIMDDITERKSREERMRYLAQHDLLTGLANRALLGDRIQRAILGGHRNGRKVAVLMLDLDCFKEINDTYGHAAGDLLLKQVARRLLGAIRRTDTVSRLGGDEFVIVLPDLRARVDAERIAQKVVEEFSPTFELESRRVKVGVSIGIALYPDDATDAEALCRSADAAMYRSKQSRKEASTVRVAACSRHGRPREISTRPARAHCREALKDPQRSEMLSSGP
jgi:diguanylate cyclase (GGDEF)-like protein/PAS domain S-box-containing protein